MLGWSLAAGLLPVATFAQQAATVRFLVPFTAGGGTDGVARLLAQQLQHQLDSVVVVENRPGAAGSLAADALARAEPDGNTLLLISNSFLTNAAISKVPYDVRKSFTPIGIVGTSPYFLLVNADSPYRNAADLVKESKLYPNRMSFGSAGPGSVTHLVGELFKQRVGVGGVHIPYKGTSAALIDLISNQLQFMFSDIASALPHIKSGKLRALAVTSQRRLPAAPDVPTAVESGINLVAVGFYGLLGPAKMPAATVKRINNALKVSLQAPEVKAQLASMEVSIDDAPLSPAQFQQRFLHESDLWQDLVKKSGIKFD